MKDVAILTDTTLCTGCEACVAACKAANGLGPDRPRRGQASIDDLSSTRFTTIVRRPGNRFVRRQCRHCAKPACASACIVGALKKTPEGAVVYDGKKCMGCRYCLMACPYGIPRYEWESAAPYVQKCTLCHGRLLEGKQPACTEACPYGATVFGRRGDLLKMAKGRLQASPGKYVQKVFGELEIGGTSVLYISDIALDFLAWKPGLGDAALPDLTWASLKKIPAEILGVGGAMTAIYWIIGRRMHMQAQAALAAPEPIGEKEHE